MSDVYATISTESAGGSSTLGDISTFLLNLGLGVEAARNALNVVATNVGNNPQQLAALNAELNYLNTYGAAPQRNNWIVPALVIGGLMWFLMRGEK